MPTLTPILADIGDYFFLIVIGISVISWVISKISEGRSEQPGLPKRRTSTGGIGEGGTELDERIRQRQAERQARREKVARRRAADRVARRRQAQGLPEVRQYDEEGDGPIHADSPKPMPVPQPVLRPVPQPVPRPVPGPTPVRVPTPIVARSETDDAVRRPRVERQGAASFTKAAATRPIVAVETTRRRRSTSSAQRLRKLLRNRDSFKTIIVASEVLGPPVSLKKP